MEKAKELYEKRVESYKEGRIFDLYSQKVSKEQKLADFDKRIREDIKAIEEEIKKVDDIKVLPHLEEGYIRNTFSVETPDF